MVPDNIHIHYMEILGGAWGSQLNLPPVVDVSQLGSKMQDKLKALYRKHLSDGASIEDKHRLHVAVLELALRIAKGEENHQQGRETGAEEDL